MSAVTSQPHNLFTRLCNKIRHIKDGTKIHPETPAVNKITAAALAGSTAVSTSIVPALTDSQSAAKTTHSLACQSYDKNTLDSYADLVKKYRDNAQQYMEKANDTTQPKKERDTAYIKGINELHHAVALGSKDAVISLSLIYRDGINDLVKPSPINMKFWQNVHKDFNYHLKEEHSPIQHINMARFVKAAGEIVTHFKKVTPEITESLSKSFNAILADKPLDESTTNLWRQALTKESIA
ncbi:MAG UNVERIFIED_CONTAM: hypothetical protein LVQ98_04205 [Rickettsiaceae bacterium]|jgi:hypothetical protein